MTRGAALGETQQPPPLVVAKRLHVNTRGGHLPGTQKPRLAGHAARRIAPMCHACPPTPSRSEPTGEYGSGAGSQRCEEPVGASQRFFRVGQHDGDNLGWGSRTTTVTGSGAHEAGARGSYI